MRDDYHTPSQTGDDDQIVEGIAALDVSAGLARQRDPVASFNAMFDAIERREERLFESIRTPNVARFGVGTGRWWTVPAVAAVVVLACVGVWSARRSAAPALTEQREYVTGRDERATIQLGDGSRVVLGPDTRLRYTHPFGAHDRNVYLDGRGYFTVTQRPSAPFVVYTATSATQVLGTTFVVKAVAADSVVQVVVESGKVALRQRDSHLGTGTTLARGELGRLTAGGLMTVSHDVDASAYSSWSQDRLALTAVPVSTALHALEERYDLQFVLPPRFNMTTPVSLVLDVETADQAVENLANILGLTPTRTGRVVTLRPKS
jgi:ferric-dicitrate binding protein FerR (iron transport regulator)